jgi:hypothetical protein
MDVTANGIAVSDVVAAVKDAITSAGISAADSGRDLRVTGIQLTLNAIATTAAGGGLDFRIPFIGMHLSMGATVTKSDTHTIDITLVPQDLLTYAVRDYPVETVLLDAIGTIRTIMAGAAGGNDPFLLQEGTVTLVFAVTKDGTITLGFNSEFKNEITHTLVLTLALPPEPG